MGQAEVWTDRAKRLAANGNSYTYLLCSKLPLALMRKVDHVRRDRAGYVIEFKDTSELWLSQDEWITDAGIAKVALLAP